MSESRTSWNCKWTWTVPARDRPQEASTSSQALCVRPSREPRRVTDEECARCAFWEPIDGSGEGVLPYGIPIQ